MSKVKVLNFGSLNLDKRYSVEDFVHEGETIAAKEVETFAGGKGLNQAIALARAGREVWQAGGIGTDGELLLNALSESGVNVSLLEQRDVDCGHAIIQVNAQGKNCIIICPGANHGNTEAYIERVMDNFTAGDWVLLQNEIDNNQEIIRRAKLRGLKVAFNPSPINRNVFILPLSEIDLFILNEHEAKSLIEHLTSEKVESIVGDNLLSSLRTIFSQAILVLTLGKDGSMCSMPHGEVLRQEIYPTDVVDTTAAGDTFTGYFLNALIDGEKPEQALQIATVASSLAVSRNGAAPSIPQAAEVKSNLQNLQKN